MERFPLITMRLEPGLQHQTPLCASLWLCGPVLMGKKGCVSSVDLGDTIEKPCYEAGTRVWTSIARLCVVALAFP